MEMRVFGRTGMRLSVLGFGCGAVGGLISRGDPLDQERTIARAWCRRELLRHCGAVWQRRIPFLFGSETAGLSAFDPKRTLAEPRAGPFRSAILN